MSCRVGNNTDCSPRNPLQQLTITILFPILSFLPQVSRCLLPTPEQLDNSHPALHNSSCGDDHLHE
jgi:hypothetical protein